MAKTTKAKQLRENPIPTEGGWGWVIVAAYIVTGVTCIPIVQNFGLIYKGRLQDLGMTSTDITTIISMNSSIGQILGVVQGPLLKKLGFRIMGAIGVTFFFVGTISTGFSYSFAQFIITYGIIQSIGFTYTLTSFSMAVNTYFKKRRSRASGLLMGFTGLGPVLMPLVVTWSLGMYGTTGTTIFLAALTAHSFIGVCLLRPLLGKIIVPMPETEPGGNPENTSDLPVEGCEEGTYLLDEEGTLGYDPKRRRSSSSSRRRGKSESESVQIDKTPKNGLAPLHEYLEEEGRRLLYPPPAPASPAAEAVINTSRLYLDSEDDVLDGMRSTLDLMNRINPRALASVETLDSINNLCSIDNLTSYCSSKNRISDGTHQRDSCEESSTQIAAISRWRRIGAWLNKQFDFDLLKDPTYISITMGLSIAVIGELMFSILTPFILHEVGLDLQMSAYFMSVIAVADIISRFISPYIAEWMKLDQPRVMYIVALFCLLITRGSLLFVTGYIGLGFVAAAVGFAKGVRTVFWGLVLPHHIPLEKLGSAMSFQNLINGILIFFAGPISGKIVEINDSYLNIIYVSNAMTSLTIILWTAEYFIKKCIKARTAVGSTDPQPY